MGSLQTVYDFRLPKGYVDDDGNLHRRGSMRLATARDEIEPLRDSRVSDPDDPYLTLIVLSRVITELGSLSKVTVRDVEGLFAADLAFLQDFYGVINFGTAEELQLLRESVGDFDDTPEPGPAPDDAAAPAKAPTQPAKRRRPVVEEVPAAGGA